MGRIPVVTTSRLPRRRFVKLCATTAAAVSAAPQLLARATTGTLRHYERVRLANADGSPLKASTLEAGSGHIFNYPYRTTPCFLLHLGRAVEIPVELRTHTGESYIWPGGVGPGRSVVAFSAICAHRMTHPAKSVSFINYRHETVRFRDREQVLRQRGGVILCCSERSVYDPARGAAVLGGPADQPLCTIVLEYDAGEDALFALGSQGGEMFHRFFDAFTHRLQLEWGTGDVREMVHDQARVYGVEDYSRTRMLCGG